MIYEDWLEEFIKDKTLIGSDQPTLDAVHSVKRHIDKDQKLWEIGQTYTGRAVVRWLMSIVYLRGDFTRARDESLRGLENRSRWNPDTNFSLPDPKMFQKMNPDPTCGIGEPHPSDFYLGHIQDSYPLRLAN